VALHPYITGVLRNQSALAIYQKKFLSYLTDDTKGFAHLFSSYLLAVMNFIWAEAVVH
jgi:hypothetical protein